MLFCCHGSRDVVEKPEKVAVAALGDVTVGRLTRGDVRLASRSAYKKENVGRKYGVQLYKPNATNEITRK